MDRPLSDAERGVLNEVLARMEGESAGPLREQVAVARAVGGKPTALELDAHKAQAAPNLPDGPLPIAPWAFDEAGTPLGVFSVWVKAGYLAGIEFGWVTDDPPSVLPPATSLRFE